MRFGREFKSALNISFQWRSAVVPENGEAYNFPGEFTRFFQARYCVPVVYRWRVLKKQPEEKEAVYIGEAEQLPRRIQRVLTPSKTAKDTNTNKRLHQMFQEFLSKGRKIVIEVADLDSFEVNGVRFGADTMGDTFKRRAVENILLALAQKSGEFELLNVVVDPVEEVRQKLSRLPPHELKKIIKLYGLDKPK